VHILPNIRFFVVTGRPPRSIRAHDRFNIGGDRPGCNDFSGINPAKTAGLSPVFPAAFSADRFAVK
jgi:hypothetical protein